MQNYLESYKSLDRISSIQTIEAVYPYDTVLVAKKIIEFMGLNATYKWKALSTNYIFQKKKKKNRKEMCSKFATLIKRLKQMASIPQMIGIKYHKYPSSQYHL